MDTLDFEQKMKAYADLAIHVGLNLQKGQRLLIRGPLVYGAPISAAPLIIAINKKCVSGRCTTGGCHVGR